MRLLINHLTRMRGGHICAAGVDLQTRRHVRPVLAHEPLPFYLLARYGGPFEMARIVDFGSPRHAPQPPHVEDYVFVPARAKLDRPAAALEFWGCLQELQRFSLRDIFGQSLHEIRPGRWGTLPGQGVLSLGLLRPAQPPQLYLVGGRDGRPRIRMRFHDGQFHADASVSDLRLFGDDHATPAPARIRAAAQWLADAQEVVLSVGLTREFRASNGAQPYHWLQVNNLHFRENPAWAVG